LGTGRGEKPVTAYNPEGSHTHDWGEKRGKNLLNGLGGRVKTKVKKKGAGEYFILKKSKKKKFLYLSLSGGNIIITLARDWGGTKGKKNSLDAKEKSSVDTGKKGKERRRRGVFDG